MNVKPACRVRCQASYEGTLSRTTITSVNLKRVKTPFHSYVFFVSV